ncbi:hypothetical protein Acr_00g0068550 [Actinidia rufa]|uniref:Uncharacterized protein n=1 Tax=Actinidia rufa TaxID=165716 RepID=A0A7J0DSI4_9ERIC|nr:hypothetical protein Acr_00g0068550 [Actinidia rufa]
MHRATGHKQVATSSPPWRPAYYEQTLSRDSYDDNRAATTASFHSTPVLNPAGSPPHSHSSSTVSRHSRESSFSRFSVGSLPPLPPENSF